jgi:hypothetical protein
MVETYEEEGQFDDFWVDKDYEVRVTQMSLNETMSFSQQEGRFLNKLTEKTYTVLNYNVVTCRTKIKKHRAELPNGLTRSTLRFIYKTKQFPLLHCQKYGTLPSGFFGLIYWCARGILLAVKHHKTTSIHP